MILVVIVLLAGIGLSAFFSGSETGFYRATRTRLALDALSGDHVSRGLIWLTNNPSLFVATTLVGNNLANYLATWAIVWGTSLLWTNHTNGADLAVSILMTPIIFIYGELMPKNLFFQAPNRLLRIAGPIFLCFTIAFAPLAAVLWSLGRVLESVLGDAPERLQLRLVRSELKRVLTEGHEVGVLAPTQRQIADGMFEVAGLPLERFGIPTSKLAVVRQSMSTQDILRIARRRKSPVVFVQDDKRMLIGYLHVVDLHLADERPAPKAIPRIARRESTIAALTALEKDHVPYGAVVDDHGKMLGIISARTLAESIFHLGSEAAAL